MGSKNIYRYCIMLPNGDELINYIVRVYQYCYYLQFIPVYTKPKNEFN